MGVGPSIGRLHRTVLSESRLGPGFSVVVIGAVAGDDREPSPEPSNVTQRMQLAQRGQKNFLDQVVHFRRRNAGEKDAVHQPRVAVVKASESSAVSFSGGADKSAVILEFRTRRVGHDPTLHARGWYANVVLH